MTADERDIFISHSSRDAAVAHELGDDLRAAGYSTWVAPDDIDLSGPWAEQILDAVDACRIMVVLLSDAANASAHVSREVSLAQSRRKPVIPMRIAPIRPTGALEYLLVLVQRVDAFPPPARAHFAALHAQVARLVDAAPAVARPTGGSAPRSPTTPLPPGEERRTVTVLCAAIVDEPLDTEARDPEDRRSRVRPFKELVLLAIERFGGSVDRGMGDATIAVWGAPVAHEDGPERAVRAALAMLSAAAELGGAATAAPSITIGVATGDAIVTVRATSAGEGLVAGEVVSVAVRLKDAAPPGAVLVDDRTATPTKDRIEYASEPRQASSNEAPAKSVWRAIGARSRQGSDLDRRPTTPLVGRELERSILLATFDRAVRDSSVQLATLVGEPGIGKSRLVAALAAELDDRPSSIRWRQGRCLPYGDGISFWALGEIVKAQLGILESDAADVAAAKLDAGLPAEIQDRELLKARLGSLLGVASPPATQEENFSAWRRFLEAIAGSGPTVLVFEDLHWAEDALLDFLEHVSEWAADVPLLLLCTARPEILDRRPGLGHGTRNSTVIGLRQLSEADTTSLIHAVLAGTTLPSATERLVVERSGGNPLYAQEYVRLLRDNASLDRPPAELPFPESIQALIAARLDTLPPSAKAVVHDASVIGKVFWAGGVAAIGESGSAAVGESLHEVSRRDFVRAARSSSLADEAEFSFHNILVRDVSYGQIPRSARAAKHLATARWLESKVAGRTEDLADVLAYHYSQALGPSGSARDDEDARAISEKARQYLVLAGDRALPLDVGRAERHYARALELAADDTAARLGVLERWAAAAGQGGRLNDAVAALRDAVGVYRAEGNGLGAGRSLTAVARFLARLGDPASEAAIQEAVTLLESEPPGADLVEAYAGLAAADGGRGDFGNAILNADRSLDLARNLGLPEPPRALGFRGLFRCMNGDADGLADLQRSVRLAVDRGLGRDAAVGYANTAYATSLLEGPARALEASRLALDFVERTGHVDLSVNISGNRVFYHYQIGDWDEALSDARSSATIAAETGSVELQVVRWVEGQVLAHRGRAGEAIDLADWLVEQSRAPSEVQWIVPGFTIAALIWAAVGDRDAARALLSELEELPNARADMNQYMEYIAQNVRTALLCGDVELARRLIHGVQATFSIQANELVVAQAAIAEAEGALREARRLYGQAAEAWTRYQNVPELAFALLGEGRCLLGLGETEGGHEALERARTLFDRLGARPALDEIEGLISPTRPPRSARRRETSVRRARRATPNPPPGP